MFEVGIPCTQLQQEIQIQLIGCTLMVQTGKSELINQEKSTNFLHQKRNVAAMGNRGFLFTFSDL
jgi:hypothetical protein